MVGFVQWVFFSSRFGFMWIFRIYYFVIDLFECISRYNLVLYRNSITVVVISNNLKFDIEVHRITTRGSMRRFTNYDERC